MFCIFFFSGRRPFKCSTIWLGRQPHTVQQKRLTVDDFDSCFSLHHLVRAGSRLFFPSHSLKTIFKVSYLHRGQLSVDQVDSTISGGCVFVIGSVFCAGSRLATILPLLTVCRNLCFMIICCCAIISCTTKSCALPYRQPSRWGGG